MSVAAATVAFFALVIGWFLLAFVPALRELRQGVDARALPVAADGRVSPSYFADRFRRMLLQQLAGPAEEVRRSRQTLIGRIGRAENFVVLPPGHERLQPDGDGSLDALVLALGDLELGARVAVLREAYVEGALRTEEAALMRATLADGDVDLGRENTVLRWLHTRGSLHAGADGRMFGRVSAEGVMRIESGCTFERLHAPRIDFGDGASPDIDPAADAVPRRSLRAEDVSDRAEHAGGRVRVAGDLALGERVHFVGDLVVTGRLVIGADAHVEGSVKGKHVEIGTRSRIDGAVVSAGDLDLAVDCRLRGPVLAEGEVRMNAGCRVGTPDQRSTVRASSVQVRSGCTVHGSVWAQTEGEVWA